MPYFTWDPRKAFANRRKHRVAFDEAATVLSDPLTLTVEDDHQAYEQRFLTIGCSAQARILVVVHTDDGETIRIISARQATARERKDYEDGKTH